MKPAHLSVIATGVVTTIAILSAAPGARGQSSGLPFVDGTFADADWTIETAVVVDGTTSARQQLAGGNDGPFRRVRTRTATWQPPVEKPQVIGVHVRRGSVHDPRRDGAITCLDYGEDRLMFSGTGAGQGSGPIIVQDGAWFAAVQRSPPTGRPVRWSTQRIRGLVASDFVAIHRVTIRSDPAVHPDFSATGAPLQFGFYRSNSDTSIEQDFGIDNWSFARCGGSSTPTAATTPTRASSTPTPSTAIHTATPTSFSTRVHPTPKITRWRLALPIALKQRCPTIDRPSDIVLVLDASSSMNAPAAAGRTRLAAAKAALIAFLDGLHLAPGGDAAALITFDATARTRQPLIEDEAALAHAIDGITTGSQSRLDLGLDEAARLLAKRGPSADRLAAVVLLSDGLVNTVGPAEVIASADRLKALDATLFVVALGPGADDQLLAAVASGPTTFVSAPHADRLIELIAGLAGRVTCPPNAHLGRRW